MHSLVLSYRYAHCVYAACVRARAGESAHSVCLGATGLPAAAPKAARVSPCQLSALRSGEGDQVGQASMIRLPGRCLSVDSFSEKEVPTKAVTHPPGSGTALGRDIESGKKHQRYSRDKVQLVRKGF